MAAGCEVGAERDDEHVGVEGARRRSRPARAAGSIDVDRRLHEPHARLDDVGVAVPNRVGGRRPNITSSFEKPKTKPSLWSMSTTSSVVAELVGQPRRQLEATEAGTQHDDPQR